MRTFQDGPIEGLVVKKLKQFAEPRGWLCEIYRDDEADAEFAPAMCYLSMSKPGITRGPHEHFDQADWFCFIGTSEFLIGLWDNRPSSPTFNHRMLLTAKEHEQLVVGIPKGIVHGYKNVGTKDGLVLNLPNRLYMGEGKKDKVDEIRHEEDPDSPFRLDP